MYTYIHTNTYKHTHTHTHILYGNSYKVIYPKSVIVDAAEGRVAGNTAEKALAIEARSPSAAASLLNSPAARPRKNATGRIVQSGS
jgi:hypothetical protein